MKTKTIEIERKYLSIECEVTRDGTPVKAVMTVAGMEQTNIECLEAVKNSPEMMGEIKHQIEGMDWNDHGDEGLDQYRDYLSEVKSVIKAGWPA